MNKLAPLFRVIDDLLNIVEGFIINYIIIKIAFLFVFKIDGNLIFIIVDKLQQTFFLISLQLLILEKLTNFTIFKLGSLGF